MTLFIALLLLHLGGHFDPLTILGTCFLWLAHLVFHTPTHPD
jgi:hypothetical protein